MKILTAMYTMRRGGAYDRFLMMVEALLERGCEVHCLSLTLIPIKHSFFHNHLMFFPFKNVNGFMGKLWVLLFFPFWAIWVGWRNRIDLIIAFGALYAFIQALSKSTLKKPMVTLIRGNSTFSFKIQGFGKYFQKLNRIIENIGLRLSDRIITNNEASRNEILSCLSKRKNTDVQVLYNNIPSLNISKPDNVFEMRKKYDIPENAKVLVTAGILNRGKNIESLINCLSQIGIENLYLLVVGDGTTKTDLHYKDTLLSIAKRLGVEQKVIFTGWVEKEELWKIYQASDLFVLPSLSEGMPNAMLEALGMDLPCLGNNIPGIKDILHYDELIFPPMDEKSLANKIELFFSDYHFSDRVKRLCQERKEVFKFDWKEKVFEMVLRYPIPKNCKKIERRSCI